MRRKRILISLLAIFMLPLALMLAVLLYIGSADLSQHREFIAGHISKAIGRRLSLDGELDLDLASMTSLHVSGITLANAGWATDPVMLEIRRLEVEIELLPLLKGEILIPRIGIEGVEVSLETDASGQGNWVLTEPTTAAGGEDTADTAGTAGFRMPVIGALAISSVDLSYRDEVSGRQISAILDHARIRTEKPSSPTLVDIAGQLNGYPVLINGQLALPVQLTTEDLDVPIELDASVLDLEAEASGKISGSAQAPAIDVDLQLEAEDLHKLRQVFGDVVPEVKPVSLALQLKAEQGQQVSITLETNAGKARLAAELDVRRDPPRPKLTGTVAVSDVDAVRLWAPLLKVEPDKAVIEKSTAANTAAPLQLDQALDLSWLGILDADLDLSAKQIKLPETHIKSLQAHLVIDDRLLNIDEFELVTDAGTVTSALLLNARNRLAAVELELETSALMLNKLPPLSQNPRFNHSHAQAYISLAVKGRTAAALIESVRGSVQLAYNDQERKEKLRLRLARPHQQGAADKNRFDLAADGNYHGQAIELNGYVIPPDSLLNNKKPYEIDLAYQAFGVTGTVAGTASAPYKMDGLDLIVQAKAENLKELRMALGEEIPDPGKIDLNMRVKPVGTKLHVPALRVGLDQGHIDGWLVLDTADSIPILETELAFVDLDLDELQTRLGQTTKTKKTKTVKTQADRVFSDEPLPFDALARAHISARLRASNVEHNNRRLQQAEGTINIANEKLSVSLEKLSLVKGELISEFIVDAGDRDTPAISIKLKAPQVELGELLTIDDGSSAVEGPLAVDISVTGKGNSVAQIMASMTGHVNLLMEQGSADARALDLYVGGLTAMFGTIFTEQSSKTRIECAICDIKLEEGMLTNRLALLDTQYSTVVVDGQVDLKQEKLDLKVSPEAKGVSLSVAFPVKVKGTLAKPDVQVEKTGTLLKAGELWATVVYPPTALLKFADLGDGQQNPCVTMVAEKAGIPIVEDVKKALGGVIKGTGTAVKGIGDVVKDVGSGVDNILGVDEPEGPSKAADAGLDSDSDDEKAVTDDLDDPDLFMDY